MKVFEISGAVVTENGERLENVVVAILDRDVFRDDLLGVGCTDARGEFRLSFTEAEFNGIGREMLLLIPDDFIQIAELKGRPVAFIVLLPNLNEAIADLDGRLLPFGWAKLLWRLKVRFPGSGRVPLMGVRREFHNTRFGPGLAFALIDAIRQAAMRTGMAEVEMSWILDDNLGMRNIIETMGGRVSKRYRMYEKDLR